MGLGWLFEFDLGFYIIMVVVGSLVASWSRLSSGHGAAPRPGHTILEDSPKEELVESSAPLWSNSKTSDCDGSTQQAGQTILMEQEEKAAGSSVPLCSRGSVRNDLAQRPVPRPRKSIRKESEEVTAGSPAPLWSRRSAPRPGPTIPRKPEEENVGSLVASWSKGSVGHESGQITEWTTTEESDSKVFVEHGSSSRSGPTCRERPKETCRERSKETCVERQGQTCRKRQRQPSLADSEKV